jgi:hypothetical protein
LMRICSLLTGNPIHIYFHVYVKESAMPQVTLYIDDETDEKARAAAAAAGISYSRWVSDLIRAKTLDEWPSSVRALAGDIPDFPDLAELRGNWGVDARRESLD